MVIEVVDDDNDDDNANINQFLSLNIHLVCLLQFGESLLPN